LLQEESSATTDCGDFLKWLTDHSEGLTASLSTAVVKNYEFDDARPPLANSEGTVVHQNSQPVNSRSRPAAIDAKQTVNV
jgi:hypothetical protein